MKVYIINLEKSVDRKVYMEALLKPYKDFLEIQFVKAVDGRVLTNAQVGKMWDQTGTYDIYGRYMYQSEIGCALSHRKCCELLLESGDDVCLIVEDDLVWQDSDVKNIILTSEKILQTDKARIILLSGDYWFTRKREVENICLATICEAVCAQAYLINREAAKKVVSADRKYLADDWFNLKKQGIELYGIYPHIADQNRRDFNTIISTSYEGTIRKNLSFINMMHSYYRAIVKRVLLYIGNFERKKFIN